MSTEEENNGAYSLQEKQDLEKLKKIRMQAIDAIVQNGIPLGSSRMLGVLNDLITSGEKSIHDTVANQLKYQDNDNKDNLNKLVAAVLLNPNLNIDVNVARTEEPVLSEDIVSKDILDGELEQGTQSLNTNDFIGSKDDH